MQTLLTCIQDAHDGWLLLAAAAVCVIGVFGSFSVAKHAAKSSGRRRAVLTATGVVAAGCTAWATHMIALLAFSPGMPAGFEPVMTAVSLLLGILGIGFAIAIAFGQRKRSRRLLGGLVLGLGIVALHYVGQFAYVVRGTVAYDHVLVAASVIGSLPLFALSLSLAGERNRQVRLLGAPMLLLSIAVLHLCGMASLRLTYDPRVPFPALTLPPEVLAPIVAIVCAGLFAVALLGLWFTLHAQATLRRERLRLGELANLGLEGLAICDGDIIVTANESLERMSGRRRKDLATCSLKSLIPALDIASLPEREEVEARLVNADGELVPVRVIRSAVRLGHRSQTVLAFRDQRERLSSEEKIRTLAFSDHLTGLANRTRFLDLLSESVKAASEGGPGFAVLMMDLDGFKGVNDALGHHGGDEVLRIVSERLRATIETCHVAARLGGDEFVVLTRDGADPLRADALGHRIITALEQPIHVTGHVVHVSASIGAILSTDRHVDTTQILENADLALYDAKSNGRGRVRLFTRELRQAAIERSDLTSELRDAWEARNFELYYQPQVRLSDGALVGAEALLRWNYPYRGVLAPGAFLHVLESSAIAVPVGTWILTTACRQAAAWRAAGLGDLRIGVNLFPAQLRAPDFVEVVATALRETGLSADALEIEVTENIVLQNEGMTLGHLTNLRKLGVKIAFDDFGTGFASLTMLKRIDIDRLKVDRSFIRNVDSDLRDQAIVDAIARMAQGCGLEVIAEGIETEAQARYMTSYATEGQGYFFGRPMTARDFEKRYLPEAGSAVAA
ncbi:diguanylate cyclase [Aureimonas sp. SA4125]|uniref:bifunctional diguanylate cyclase/phosphodiesterase n=1 Tax=Aureimonas sp. SA4125 TaxID=2826993 RepID=UPI001CC63AD7|nr:EAL domain-containing protein [Aureimonas sp. SA4125]BDA86707.1 diguanylate cyclase [Aureimonas sp. SA4125]